MKHIPLKIDIDLFKNSNIYIMDLSTKNYSKYNVKCINELGKRLNGWRYSRQWSCCSVIHVISVSVRWTVTGVHRRSSTIVWYHWPDVTANCTVATTVPYWSIEECNSIQSSVRQDIKTYNQIWPDSRNHLNHLKMLFAIHRVLNKIQTHNT